MTEAVVDPEAPRLAEVQGPSATGGGRGRFLDLLILISVTEFKKTYYGTVLGYFWSLARPALLFGVLLVVFTQVFRLGGVPHYAVLLLLNIVLFTYFQEATSRAVTAVVEKEGIVRKTQFPRLVIPLSIVATVGFDFALNLIPVFVFILAFGVGPMWSWLLLPLLVLFLAGITVAVAMILSVLYVRYRDVGIIWGVLATVLLYGSPVIYPYEKAPEKLQTALLFNPLTPILNQARHWIIDPGAPTAVGAAGGWLRMSISIAVYAAICLFAVWIFRREAPRIAEEL